MPELPEVETVRRGAEPLLQSKRLLRVELRRDDLRWPIPVDNIRGLEGRECTAIERRSKYLLMRFDGTRSPIAIIHLGMSGRMLVDVTTARDERPEWRLHEHWRMDFGDRLVRFIDPRRFGMLDYSNAEDLEGHKLIRVLGREPLEPGFDGAFLQSIRRGKKASIKSMLMDGRLIAGENRLDERGFLRRVLCAHHPPLARQEIVHGDDREQGQQQGEEDPLYPLADHSAKSVPLHDEHREEAADDEKQWHAEHVDHRVGQEEQAVLTGILNGPGTGEKAQAGMQDDSEQHGDAAQGVEVGSPRGIGAMAANCLRFCHESLETGSRTACGYPCRQGSGICGWSQDDDGVGVFPGSIRIR